MVHYEFRAAARAAGICFAVCGFYMAYAVKEQRAAKRAASEAAAAAGDGDDAAAEGSNGALLVLRCSLLLSLYSTPCSCSYCTTFGNLCEVNQSNGLFE